eukprot:GEMP01016671.1.p1 GENE.GEMP01016671.1~~GEMP01016671.1.p1  ORF type:complete len:358 (+),score=79.77 GEMP01016671.1:34-1107(+)
MRSSAPNLPGAISSRLPKFPFRKISAPASFEEDRGCMAASTTNFVRLDTWGGSSVPETEMHAISTETMFEEYEREARMLFEKVQEELYTVEAGAPSDKAESMLAEISQNRRALQMRIRTDRSLRPRWGPMLEEWDAQLGELRKTLKTFHERNRRSELFDARQQAAIQIKNSEDKLEEGTHLLENAHREILETENIGSQITSDLASQREVILHARGSMAVVGNELQTASAIVKDIFNANRIRKYSSYIAIGFLALLFFAVYCYFGWPGRVAANLPPAITMTAKATHVPLQPAQPHAPAPDVTRHPDDAHDSHNTLSQRHDAYRPVQHSRPPSPAATATAVTPTASEDVPNIVQPQHRT